MHLLIEEPGTDVTKQACWMILANLGGVSDQSV